MTALAIQPDVTSARGGQPSGRRLIAASIVASLGAIALSVAFAGFVAASRLGLPAQAASDAQALAGWVPAIVALGFVHLFVAAAMLSGRDLVRLVAVAVTGLVAIAAATASAMVASGVDPFGGAAAGHSSAAGVGILALAAVLYGAAALAAGTGPAEG